MAVELSKLQCKVHLLPYLDNYVNSQMGFGSVGGGWFKVYFSDNTL